MRLPGKVKHKKAKGKFDKGSSLNKYQTCCSKSTVEPIVYTPLLIFEKENFLTRSNSRTLAKRKLIFLTKWKNRYYVAVNPLYNNINPRDLLEKY